MLITSIFFIFTSICFTKKLSKEVDKDPVEDLLLLSNDNYTQIYSKLVFKKNTLLSNNVINYDNIDIGNFFFFIKPYYKFKPVLSEIYITNSDAYVQKFSGLLFISESNLCAVTTLLLENEKILTNKKLDPSSVIENIDSIGQVVDLLSFM